MKQLLLIILVAGAATACNKDSFKTKPHIQVESYNTRVLDPAGTLIIGLKYTDKEGDLGNGTFVYIPQRTNIKKLPPDLQYDPVSSTIPQFPDHDNGTINVTLPWNLIHKSDLENDTIYFKFVATDRAGNVSDTVRSDQIVILHQ